MKFNRSFWWQVIGSSASFILGVLILCGLNSRAGEGGLFWFLLCLLLLGCGVFGLALSLVLHPIRKTVINIPTRIFLFGTFCGLLWSFVPSFLLGDEFKSGGEAAVVLLAGIISGILVSFILYKPLSKSNRTTAVGLGLFALPLGAFCFGVCVSLVCLAARHITGENIPYGGIGDDKFMPIMEGVGYAVLSVISIFAVFLFPLAVLTTFLLRSVILYRTQNQSKSA